MDLQLTGKKALVSGSSKGIGLAIARQLAAEGAEVMVTGRCASTVDAALAHLRQLTPSARVDGFVGDLTLPNVVDDLIQRIPDVDILVNNLGIFEPKPFSDIDDADWLRLFETNVMSGVRLSRAYLPSMRQRNWGRIIFMSSESAIQIPVEMIHYGVTKTAQLALSRGLAETCAGTGVTVNAILPGPTHTEGVDDFVTQLSGQPFARVEQTFLASVRPSSLIQRFATPEEVAHLVTFVCSPLASAITGAALRVDGGVVRACF